MKKSTMLAVLLCLVAGSSLLGGVTAADYVGIAVDDVFVYELSNGDAKIYQKYEITAVTEVMTLITATADYTIYDVENDVTATGIGYNFRYLEGIGKAVPTKRPSRTASAK